MLVLPTTTSTVPPPAALATPVPAGSIIISGQEGIRIRSSDLLVPVLGVARATGDGAGGLLLQQANMIWWLRADGSEAELVAVGEQASAEVRVVSVTLMDGVLIDGTPYALYVLTEHDGESVFPDVIVHNLSTGETRAYLTDQGYEGGVGDVSYADGVLSVSNSAEGCTWFDVVTLDGSVVPFPNPFGGGCDRPEFPYIGGGVLSSDGRTMVYLSSEDYADEDVPTDLVLYDLGAGEELSRLTLPLGRLWNRVDYDGTRVLVSTLVVVERWVYGESILIDTIDSNSATTTELPVTGLAAFTK